MQLTVRSSSPRFSRRRSRSYQLMTLRRATVRSGNAMVRSGNAMVRSALINIIPYCGPALAVIWLLAAGVADADAGAYLAAGGSRDCGGQPDGGMGGPAPCPESRALKPGTEGGSLDESARVCRNAFRQRVSDGAGLLVQASGSAGVMTME